MWRSSRRRCCFGVLRSRLYLKHAKTENNEEPDPDLRVLEVMKSNYGPIGEKIDLRWKDGLFLPVAGASDLERLAAEQEADQRFLALLDQFKREGNNVSAKRNAPNYAPAMFAKEKQRGQQKIKKADFEDAMRRLLDTGKISVQQYGPPSHDTFRLVKQ